MIVATKVIRWTLIIMTLLADVRCWKTCDQTFCGRVRRSPEGYPRYSLDLTNLTISPQFVEGYLMTEIPSQNLYFRLEAPLVAVFSVHIGEMFPAATRKKIKNILKKQAQTFPLKIVKRTFESVTLENGNTKAVIYGKPFKIEFYSDDKLVSVINSRERLVYEMGKNNTAIALDVLFVGAQRAYGIPLHAEHLPLQNTGPGILDPYRLFNLHYANYKTKSPEALHGSIPVLYGHGTKQSSGILWYNYAQTWVDITTGPNQVDAYFMSESPSAVGGIGMFVFPGPTLHKAVKQYTSVSGYSLIPPYISLGYHQSRSSYITQDEVLEVVKHFDEKTLPLEAVWLDIDYTDNRKYFTWDPDRFPKPLEMQEQLSATNRTLFAVINPHFKAERGYFVHDEATAKGYYVRNPGGSDYIGLCSPGLSGYWDFINPDALAYYGTLHSAETFKSKNVYMWNDMNEPVVFDNMEHENTLAGDLVHYGNFKHRDLHNMFGLLQAMGTFSGFRLSGKTWRPFSLTRSHFVTIQVYAAVSTGDNYASWEHLEISFPMCLVEALAGVSFCGANVGGFNGIPDDELYQRWYQAGAWLPFYRAHFAKDVPRREPYLYSDGIQARVRAALNQRYAHLPVWYTLWWEHILTREPVIRPITYHYPSEDDALSIDNEILVGRNILAAPILKQGVFMASVYLPGGESEFWYNIDDNYKMMVGTGHQVLYVNLDSVPVFYRGGSIISRKNTPRQTTAATHGDPYTIYVCLDKNNQANGTLYVDDYVTYNYTTSAEYLYIGFSFVNNTLSSHKLHPNADYDGAAGIGQVVILGLSKSVAGARLIVKNNNNSDHVKLTYSKHETSIILSDFLLSLRKPFKIELHE